MNSRDMCVIGHSPYVVVLIIYVNDSFKESDKRERERERKDI